MQPAWCRRIIADLDAADARARALANGLTVEQLNWTPRRGSWSIGQCLEHLCLSNEVYVAPIEDALRAAPAGPVDEITLGWFSRWFVRSFIEPTTQKARAKSPRKSTPVSSRIDASIVDRFIASNAAVRDLVARAARYDVNRVRFKNPFVSAVRFTVGTGFQIVARHNHRHLIQAERRKELPGYPT